MEAEAEKLNEQVSNIDSMYKRTMDTANTQALYTETLREIYDRLPSNPGGFVEDVTADNYLSKRIKFPFNDAPAELNARKEEYMAKPESERFTAQSQQLQNYLRFRTAIHTKGPSREEDMPDIDTFFSDYTADDEMVVEKAKVSYKCPISNSLLVDPVTNPRCNHTFSKASVTDMFKHAGASIVSCPVPACSAMMHKNEMRANPDMAEAVARYRSRLAKETQRQTATLERI
ncbi:hypothetical protein TRVA0_072S00144 [Trichomonascus vanleenenianus]|uniref:SUMO ligase MMS21 n=1 Tax=Trichomonascus vanleenenianus TaxID=2268995 RepID=UPI003ECACEA5